MAIAFHLFSVFPLRVVKSLVSPCGVTPKAVPIDKPLRQEVVRWFSKGFNFQMVRHAEVIRNLNWLQALKDKALLASRHSLNSLSELHPVRSLEPLCEVSRENCSSSAYEDSLISCTPSPNAANLSRLNNLFSCLP